MSHDLCDGQATQRLPNVFTWHSHNLFIGSHKVLGIGHIHFPSIMDLGSGQHEQVWITGSQGSSGLQVTHFKVVGFQHEGYLHFTQYYPAALNPFGQHYCTWYWP